MNLSHNAKKQSTLQQAHALVAQPFGIMLKHKDMPCQKALPRYKSTYCQGKHIIQFVVVFLCGVCLVVFTPLRGKVRLHRHETVAQRKRRKLSLKQPRNHKIWHGELELYIYRERERDIVELRICGNTVIDSVFTPESKKLDIVMFLSLSWPTTPRFIVFLNLLSKNTAICNVFNNMVVKNTAI